MIPGNIKEFGVDGVNTEKTIASYTTMVIIAVITDDTLPEGIHHMKGKAQKYCLSL